MDIEWIRIEFEEFLGLNTLDYDHETVQERRRMYQTIIDHAHRRNIKVLGIVGANSMPGWIYMAENETTGEQEFSGNGLERYIEAFEWHITTYDVDALEVWNEPRIFGFQDVHGTLARLPLYAELLIRTYSQLKPTYPEMTFVAPVTSNAVPDTWIGSGTANPEYSIFNSSAMREYRDENDDALPLDVISWHPYGATVPSGGGPLGNFYYGETFAQYHADVLAYTDTDGRSIVGDYPIWLTEYGFEERQTGGGTNQREYYEDWVDAMADYPQIEATFWYTYLDDDPTASGTENLTYGMRKFDSIYTPKEVFYSFAGLSSGVGMRDDFNVEEELVSYYLDNGGKTRIGIPEAIVQIAGGIVTQSFSHGSLGPITLRYDGTTVTMH